MFFACFVLVVAAGGGYGGYRLGYQTASLEAVRMDGSISRDIGWDLSAGFLYRPFLNQNVLVRVGSAVLLPEAGQENLFGNQTNYHAFTNLILQY